MSVKVIPQRNLGMAPTVVIKVNARTDAFTVKHDIGGAGGGLYSVSEFQAR